jgi:hypothetical protein
MRLEQDFLFLEFNQNGVLEDVAVEEASSSGIGPRTQRGSVDSAELCYQDYYVGLCGYLPC